MIALIISVVVVVGHRPATAAGFAAVGLHPVRVVLAFSYQGPVVTHVVRLDVAAVLSIVTASARAEALVPHPPVVVLALIPAPPIVAVVVAAPWVGAWDTVPCKLQVSVEHHAWAWVGEGWHAGVHIAGLAPVAQEGRHVEGLV